MILPKIKVGYIALIFAGLVQIEPSFAGFLEMPDTTEAPEIEPNSMLKDLDIPAVPERDPDPSAGPRLNVTEFRVQGVVEYPELGITRESLNALVESIRFDMMEEGEMLDSGYTLDEVSEMSDLIAEIEQDTKEDYVGPLELQRLVFLIRDQRLRRGVTVGMIENVADTITRYYRERGFILAKAYIPEQRVRDGSVTLTLLLGNLGEVKVLNNKRFKSRSIEKIFSEDLGEPITAARIEEKLYFVNDMPGLQAQAYFEPGSQVGDTLLNVNLVEEKRFSGNVRLDNHGSDSTGEFRIYTDGYWNNPSGFGDQLHIGLLGTFSPSNSTYGSIHYGFPLFGPRANLTFGGSTNDFVSSLEGLTLTGESLVADATLNYILKRSREKNLSVELRASNVDTDIASVGLATEGAAGPDIGQFDTEVRTLDAMFNFDLVDERFRGLHQGGVRLSTVSMATGQRYNQKDNPLIFAANYSLLKFIKVPFSDSQSRLVVNSALQYTDAALPSISQFPLSGPNRMRAFDINTYNADRGVYLGVDWIFNSPSFSDFEIGGEKLSTMLQPYVFWNAAWGHNTGVGGVIMDGDNPNRGDALSNTKLSISDIGFGLKFAFKNKLRASFSFAQGLLYKLDEGETSNGEPVEQRLDSLDSENKWYFDVQYSY